ncbi:low molecular weight phosphatase family protein [Streptomyces sp. NPDC056112]|uniref:arsenate-mycothiol transferase ArsC n=1 Tax=Streptomyces sp. NPDC056112 TaxID=3345715 RepID=UPI0035DA891D
MQHRAPGQVAVSSAGTHPAPEIEPHIERVLSEAGADPTAAFPKPLTDEVVSGADIVITMGCGDACPIVPGRRYLDWPVPDPDGAPINVVREIRDVINARITELLASLPST